MASAPFNTTIDNLVYSYGSTNKNELRRVADGTNAQGFKNGSNTDDDYAYDANGNMTIDKNKGITAISYNQLNLPVKIEFGINKIEYLYNATGQKVQKKVTQGSTVTTTDYLGGFQYNGTVLDFFPHAEGYIKRETTGIYTYVFNYTDHLGNVRVSYKKNGSTLQILEESNYYPFGLKHEPNTVVNNQPSYKYKYQGQERQDELGLNWDSFKWRNYDPAIGRFVVMDKLAEDYSYQSPYNFAENRVMDGRELEGLEWRSSTSSDGKTVSLTLSVRTINNTSGIISNKQMAILANERAAQLSASMGGVDAQGRTVNVKVKFNDNATIAWEYSNGNDTTGRTYTGKDAAAEELGDQMAPGLTDKIGDTQNNRTQINMGVEENMTFDANGNPNFENKTTRATAAKNGAHEDLHTAGGRHEKDDSKNKLAAEQKADTKNIMNKSPQGTNVLPAQRSEMIKLIESQQPKKPKKQ